MYLYPEFKNNNHMLNLSIRKIPLLMSIYNTLFTIKPLLLHNYVTYKKD